MITKDIANVTTNTERSHHQLSTSISPQITKNAKIVISDKLYQEEETILSVNHHNEFILTLSGWVLFSGDISRWQVVPLLVGLYLNIHI